MNIEFGSGGNLRDGFVGCDIRKLDGVEFVCNAWDICDFVEPNSVDKVYSRHFFEHLTFYQGKQTLDAWRKILKIDGSCEIILPNMDFHVKQWLESLEDEVSFNHAHAGFWGWQRENGSIWDIHKSGYNFKTLNKLLIEHGFTNIEQLHKLGIHHLHVICTPN